jgi:hypothetical protein
MLGSEVLAAVDVVVSEIPWLSRQDALTTPGARRGYSLAAGPPDVYGVGIPVDDRLVLDLARRLRDADLLATAAVLEDAYDAEPRVAALTITDREAILRVLEDAPEGLAELRGVLLKEHEWRVREGLVERRD